MNTLKTKIQDENRFFFSLYPGQLVEFIKEHPEHEEDWWEAKNENGEIGYIPSAYVIVKKDHVYKSSLNTFSLRHH